MSLLLGQKQYILTYRRYLGKVSELRDFIPSMKRFMEGFSLDFKDYLTMSFFPHIAGFIPRNFLILFQEMAWVPADVLAGYRGPSMDSRSIVAGAKDQESTRIHERYTR